MKLRGISLKYVRRGDTLTDPVGSKFAPPVYGSQAYLVAHAIYQRPLITMNDHGLHRTGFDLMNDQGTGWLNLIEEAP